jgi:hypothetical protein
MINLPDISNEPSRAIQNSWFDLRKMEYPPLTDLADAMYWASQGDNTKLDNYYAACEAVKLKYPKS